MNLDINEINEIQNEKLLQSYFPNYKNLKEDKDKKIVNNNINNFKINDNKEKNNKDEDNKQNEEKKKEELVMVYKNEKENENEEIKTLPVHINYRCDGCQETPIIGIRYHCKVCDNFDYCENCMIKEQYNHKHEFEKIENAYKNENSDSFIISLFLFLSQIKDEYSYLKGIYFYKSSIDEFEIDILKIFQLLTKNSIIDTEGIPINFRKKLPLFYNLLMCNEMVLEKYIYSFCLRAINSISNNIFIIVRPELFDIGSENFFFKTFTELLEKKKYNINSCIIILYINQNSHIIKQLKKIGEKYGFSNPPIFKNIPQYELENLEELDIEIITSDLPRTGKSTYILNNFKQGYIVYIPLSEIDKPYLLFRTDSINGLLDKGEDILIQMELFPYKNEQNYMTLRYFLFFFLILRCYQFFDYFFYNKIKIKIEVSSDYTENFLEDYKILQLFKRHHIPLKNNPEFYERNPINPQKGIINSYNNVFCYLNLLSNNQINEKEVPLKLFNLFFEEKIDGVDYNNVIKKFFIEKFSSENLPNYGQINNFVKQLNKLFEEFTKCEDLKIDNLQKYWEQIKSLKKIRGFIIDSYVDLIVKFSTFSYENILENQRLAIKNQNKTNFKLTTEEKQKLINIINQKKIISYDSIKPGIILFNNITNKEKQSDLELCSIITSFNENTEEYKMLKDLYVNYFQIDPDLRDYNDAFQNTFIRELKNICLTPNSNNQKIYEQCKDFVFTMDNFVKMILIYLRIKSDVPLILLGETGCGKTLLIKTLLSFLEGKYKLITYNVHSGISFYDISLFLNENNLFDEELTPIENFIEMFFGIKMNFLEKEKIILFFDEINTTDSIYLLSEIFNSKKFLNRKLKPNIYVIGACNPYRLIINQQIEIGYINKSRHKIRNLVYTVNPLPLSLINYVFDFGNIKEKDEIQYIKIFIDSYLHDKFSKDNNNNYSKILNIIGISIFTCQKYIREKNEISSVSLREIKRFRIFLDFFLKIINDRKDFEIIGKTYLNWNSELFPNMKISNKQISDNLKYLKATNLSLFICYFIRIINPENRKELSNIISSQFKFDFLEYPLILENDLVNNINLEKGIARNRAFLDNLFSLFVCINNKIPLFICGKAGCSKTLSFSLLYQAMKGTHSNSPLLQKYPTLYLNSYQGSLTSSSKEIQTIFERAKKIVKQKSKRDNNKNDYISLILFDEMGLAEISPLNPLKVIHSELDGNQEIGFVGISNWTLDASKMNRGIHLSIPEPDLNDLLLTSITIAKGIYEEIGNIEPYKNIIENLTKSYFDYKQYLLKKYESNYDFHGARDFYYLIKIASRLIKDNSDNKSLESIAMESIERNFGGLELNKEDNNIWNSTKKFKEIFNKYQNNNIENINKYDIFNCIKNNITGENNRYLLIMTNKTKNETLIEFILKKLNLEYRFIQGSKLKEDQNETYTLQKAWSIISSMEKGEIIILKDMEILYPKFYDLFNQNLFKYGNEYYARIVLDSTTNERHIVHKNFKCIILLEKKDVSEQDPPFLNRFEKHLMSFKNILTEKQNLFANEIYEQIKEITSFHNNNNNTISPLLVNVNLEEIRCLILESSYKNENNEESINSILKSIVPTFSQENILNAIFSPISKNIHKEKLIEFYENDSHTNIYKFLEKIENRKFVIYTFSPYYKDVFNELEKIEIKNQKFGIFSKDNTVEFIFNEMLSEKRLEYFFQLYYEKEKINLFIIHFREKNLKYLSYTKFQLENFEKNNQNNKKIFLFIIHIKKNILSKIDHGLIYEKDEIENKKMEKYEKYYSYYISFLSEFQQITIDNLLEHRNISILQFYNKTNEELLNNEELINIKIRIKMTLSQSLTLMKTSEKIDNFINKINNIELNGLLDILCLKIKNTIKNSDNILIKSLKDYSILQDKDYDFFSFFIESINNIISENLRKILNELGKNGYLISMLFEKEIPEKIRNYVFPFIDKIDISKSEGSILSNNYLIDLKIPGSLLLFNKLISLIKNCKIEFINKENEYRTTSSKKKDKNVKILTLEQVYSKKRQYLKDRLWNEELLNEDIFGIYSKEIIHDFFKIYFFKEKNEIMNNRTEEFLYFLFKQKNKNDKSLNGVLDFMLWLGSYNEAIIKIIDIFKKIDNYFLTDNYTLLSYLKDNYDSINFFDGPNNTEEKEKVNLIFYKISEGICLIIINQNIMKYDKITNFQNLYTELNEIVNIFFQLNSTLNLSLRGQYSILSLIKFIQYYLKKNINLNEENFKQNLKNFINNINAEMHHFSKGNINDAKNSCEEQINLLSKLSDKLTMKILINKLLQFSKNNNYRYYLMLNIFKNPSLIKHSILFFNFILLTQVIKPKYPSKKINEQEKEKLLDNFCEIRKKIKDNILDEINKNKSEIMNEILIYIFDFNLNLYFENLINKNKAKVKFNEIITGINFDYFLRACNFYNKKEDNILQNIAQIYYISFIRCYLFHVITLLIEENDIGNLNKINKYLYDNNSSLGILLKLYIMKLFILKNKEEYFYKNYLNDENQFNWKQSILEQNINLMIFPMNDFENYKHLLFDIGLQKNNNFINKEFFELSEIKDIIYMISISFNEIIQKISTNNFDISKIFLTKLNEEKDNFKFDKLYNDRIKNLIFIISQNEFLNNEQYKNNLKLIFHIIQLYLIGYSKSNFSLFNSIYSDDLVILFKLFNDFNELEELDKNYIINYYKIKEHLETNYIKNNKYIPIYVCENGSFFIKNDSSNYSENQNCPNCNKTMKENHIEIFYNESQKEYIENG